MADQLISPRNGQVALPDQGRKPFAMAWQRSGTTLHKSIGKELLNGGSSEPTWRPPSCPQARMVQGPSRSLGLAAPRCDWSRSCKKISLPRFRLCGWSSIRTALDLHSTDCGCDEFEEAVLAADELVAQAKELHQSDWPKLGPGSGHIDALPACLKQLAHCWALNVATNLWKTRAAVLPSQRNKTLACTSKTAPQGFP
jgi:hypothetical protein